MGGKDEELSIYIDRVVMMCEMLEIYQLVLQQPGKPEVDIKYPHTSMRGTMMAVLYSFFYSLIENRDDSIDFFRIWKVRMPECLSIIEELEDDLKPLRDPLRLFRNKFGFHGSVSRIKESKGLDLYGLFSGKEIMDLIVRTLNLHTELTKKYMAKSENK